MTHAPNPDRQWMPEHATSDERLPSPLLAHLRWCVVKRGVWTASGYTEAQIITRTKAEAVAWLRANVPAKSRRPYQIRPLNIHVNKL